MGLLQKSLKVTNLQSLLHETNLTGKPLISETVERTLFLELFLIWSNLKASFKLWFRLTGATNECVHKALFEKVSQKMLTGRVLGSVLIMFNTWEHSLSSFIKEFYKLKSSFLESIQNNFESESNILFGINSKLEAP